MVRWTELFLGADGRLDEGAPTAGEVEFATAGDRASWSWRVPRDLGLCGPMALRLRVSLQEGDDANLFAGVEKWRDGRFVPFEGSYGFGLDRVTAGWMKLSHRELEPEASRPFAPVNRDDVERPLEPGEVAEVELALGPSATFFRAGEEVRLILGGRWPNSRNLVTGQFLATYEPSPDRIVRIHCGGAPAPRLLVPVIAPPA